MSEPGAKPYPEVPAQPSFPELEGRVAARWRKERTFERSVGQRPAGENEYVFYDGPPFANGLPHFGHLLTSYVKDVVPRYQTLRGPLALGSPKIQCGKYKTAPGICNDQFQAFTYKGKGSFTRASGWIGP